MRDVRLGDVLERARRPLSVKATARYEQIGIRSHGKGIFHKAAVTGAELGAKKVFEIRERDLVLNIVFAWEGAVAVAGPDDDGRCGSHRFPTYVARDGESDVQYLRLFFETELGRRILQLASPGSAGRNRTLNQQVLLDSLVPLPPLAEQRRIVDLIAAVAASASAAAKKAGSARAVAERYRRRLFEAREWPLVPLVDAVEVTMGRQRSPKHATGDNVIPYLRAANVKDGYLDLSDVKKMNFTPTEQMTFSLRSGDTLVTEGCGSRKQIGACAIWKDELPNPICFQNTLLRLRSTDRTDPHFVYQWSRYAFEQARFADISSGTNIFHIGSERAKRMPFLLPPLDAQAHAVSVLSSLDAATEAAAEVERASRHLRTALLDDLLSGEHEIPESYDRLLEPA